MIPKMILFISKYIKIPKYTKKVVVKINKWLPTKYNFKHTISLIVY